MKKFLSVAAFLLLIIGSRAAADVFPVNQFGGINTDNNPLTLKGKTPDSQNVRTDEGPGLTGRKGFVDFSTDTADAMWELPHSNGTRYFIKWSASEDRIEASQGGTSFNINISTVADGVSTSGAILGDSFYLSNATDGLKRVTFSGATPTVTVASSTLNFTQIASWKGRLWGIGEGGSERILFGSAYTDGTDWTLDTNPTDESPIQRTISGGFDEVLTALFPSPFDTLLVFKAHSFGAVSGSNYNNFYFSVLSKTVGTSYPETIQECDGYVRFMGPNRTIWEYKGGLLRPEDMISVGIDELMDTFSQGDANQRIYTLTTQSDWQTGTLNGDLSATSSPGDVQFSTFGVLIDTFTDGDYTASPAWTVFNQVSPATATISSNVLLLSAGTDDNSEIGIYTSVSISTGAWTFRYTSTGTSHSYVGANFEVRLCANAPTQASFGTEEGGCYLITFAASSDSTQLFDIENSTGGAILDTSTDANPRYYDGSWHNIKIDRNTNGIFRVFVDDTLKGTSSADVTVTSITYISVAVNDNQYAGTAQFDDFRFQHHTSSFTTPTFNIGTGISSWGTFEADNTLNGGTMSYAIYTDTDSTTDVSNAATFTSSQTITSGSIPTIATAAYAAFGSTFTRTSSTQTPTLSLLSQRWNEGSTIRAASAYVNQRYWLGLAVSSTSNNRVLVFDRNREWQLYAGINATSMLIYNNEIYFGNSSGIFQAETGYNDDGANIEAYYKTAMYAPAGLDLYTALDCLYVTTENSPSTLSTVFQINGINTNHTMGDWTMDTNSGYQNFKLPFSWGDVQKTKYVDFKFSVTGSSAWRLLNANVYHTPDRTTE